jgi:hypothetical protein
VTPRIQGDAATCDQLFAVALHELGHCLSERCEGGDHRPDPSVVRWHNCIRCEQLAWDRALTLAPFSRSMFNELRRGLAIYRQQTPAPASAVEALDVTRGTVTLAANHQRHMVRRVDVARARLAWAMLTPAERVDHQIADQRRRREQMRGTR